MYNNKREVGILNIKSDKILQGSAENQNKLIFFFPYFVIIQVVVVYSSRFFFFSYKAVLTHN